MVIIIFIIYSFHFYCNLFIYCIVFVLIIIIYYSLHIYLLYIILKKFLHLLHEVHELVFLFS